MAAKLLRIALDAMGGDHGPNVTVAAAVEAIAGDPLLHITLVGKRDELEECLHRFSPFDEQRLVIHHAAEVVEMHEPPALASRKKKDSSMRVALNLVKSSAVDACVSAGNTGALMATARFVLRTLPGIDRPAIMTAIPTTYGHTHVLDLGANVDCTEEQLFQFAMMGSALKSAIGTVEPSVALLNIGIEDIKGNERVKGAANLLSASKRINYVGYIEANDVFHRPVDVVVCDGFVGNVALKSAEGMATMLQKALGNSFRANLYTKLIALLTYPILKQVRRLLDPRLHNGASLVGLQGTVIKSHGSADKIAFATAIKEAVIEVKNNVPRRISEHMASEQGEMLA